MALTTNGSKQTDIVSVVVDFLEVAIHCILFSRKIYPEGIFTLKKKYNAPVYVSMQPDLNQYITDALTAVKHLIKLKELKRIDVCFFNQRLKPVERVSFILTNLPFNISQENIMESGDPYLNQIHENFRAFCLKVSVSTAYLKPLPEGTTFRIQIHTTETSSVSLAENPLFQSFPWVEAESRESTFEESEILPIRNIDTDFMNIEIFAEESEFK